MPSVKLTNRAIESYKWKGKGKEYSDSTNGLVLRVTKTKKVFSYRYRDSEAKSRRKKIGEFPLISLKEARDIAKEYFLNISKDNIYPHDISETVNSPTPKLSEVYNSLKENDLKRSLAKTSYTSNTSTIEKNIIPVFGKRSIDSIARREISDFLQKCLNENEFSISHTRKIRQLLSQIFEHGKLTQRILQTL